MGTDFWIMQLAIWVYGFLMITIGRWIGRQQSVQRPAFYIESDDLDSLAKGVAARLGEQPAEIGDDTINAFADAVRDRVNEVTVSATDLDLFAAKVMELADKRRAEREAAKKPVVTLEGFQVGGPAVPVEPAATPEPPKDGQYKPDDLVEVFHDDEWKRGWYVSRWNAGFGDDEHHSVSFVAYTSSDGEPVTMRLCFSDSEIRHRRPATVAAT